MSASPPKALLFDVFGTCVDWRTTVTNALVSACNKAIISAPLSDVVGRASALTQENWGEFAQQWRNTYIEFVGSIAKDPSIPWKSVDQHHLDALRVLLREWKLDGIWTDEEILNLSLVWHKLDPWDDSAAGIRLLNTVASTCTLSNGNVTLLSDLAKHGRLEFTHLFSAEHFNSYKPSPRVYLGAVEKLGLRPDECMMVAAHLSDLAAAKKYGLQAAYVERPNEEAMSPEKANLMKNSRQVDIWIPEDADGFLTLAAKLGAVATPTM